MTASRPVPSTGTPMISAPCFSGSSSRKPLTSYWLAAVGVDFANQLGPGRCRLRRSGCRCAPCPERSRAKASLRMRTENRTSAVVNETYERVDDENRPRHRRPDPEHRHRGKQRRASEVAEEDQVQIRNADESPQAAVESGPIEDRQFHQNRDQQRPASESEPQPAGIDKVERSRKAAVTDSPTAARWQARSSQTSICRSFFIRSL